MLRRLHAQQAVVLARFLTGRQPDLARQGSRFVIHPLALQDRCGLSDVRQQTWERIGTGQQEIALASGGQLLHSTYRLARRTQACQANIPSDGWVQVVNQHRHLRLTGQGR